MSVQRRNAALRTTESFPQMRRLLVGAVLTLALACTALADEQKPSASPLDVKKAFSTICGYCHGDFGRKAGRGPQLMNSERTDEFLFNRIKNGMQGQMAAFSSAFSEDQIRQIVK